MQAFLFVLTAVNVKGDNGNQRTQNRKRNRKQKLRRGGVCYTASHKCYGDNPRKRAEKACRYKNVKRKPCSSEIHTYKVTRQAAYNAEEEANKKFMFILLFKKCAYMLVFHHFFFKCVASRKEPDKVCDGKFGERAETVYQKRYRRGKQKAAGKL